ncbi:MAG TPA: aminomethyltransferase family protein [Candidatus Acidoferrales bacterium]|nr:aminomethyltransferase family protein [Candidatus Acidoferrales bacterium]
MSEERRSALEATLESAGARFASLRGVRVAESFGDVAAEVRAVRGAAGVMDRNDRAYLTASGPDAASFLQRMTSNEISGLEPGQGRYGLQLNAQGHIVADFYSLRMDDHVLLETDWARREPLREVLEKHIIADDVEVRDASERLASLSVEGPQSERLLKAALSQGVIPGSELNHAWVRLHDSPVLAVRLSETGEEGFRLIFVVEYAQNVWEALVAQRRHVDWKPVGHAALNILRTEAGIPWYGAELTEQTLPPEAGLEQRAISYTKGCYLGQEIIERIRSRGHVNRRLVGLTLEGVGPVAGAKLLREGKEVGVITTAVHSPTLGLGIALGYARREQGEVGTRLEVEGGGAAEVAALPFYQKAT